MTDAGLRGVVAPTAARRGPPSSWATIDSAESGKRVARQACWTSGGRVWIDCAADGGTVTATATTAATQAARVRQAARKAVSLIEHKVDDIGGGSQKTPA